MTSGSGVDAYRPLVAVVAYHLADDRVARWPDGGYEVPALHRRLPPLGGRHRDHLARRARLSRGRPRAYDGLLLVGGGDVDPSRYGAVPDLEHNYGVESDRDAFETDLLLTAERTRVPARASVVACRS